METLRSKTIICRKEHICWGCRTIIPAKSRILTVVTVDGGTINTARWCTICSEVLRQYRYKIDPWDEGMPDGIIIDEFIEYYNKIVDKMRAEQ